MRKGEKDGLEGGGCSKKKKKKRKYIKIGYSWAGKSKRNFVPGYSL